MIWKKNIYEKMQHNKLLIEIKLQETLLNDISVDFAYFFEEAENIYIIFNYYNCDTLKLDNILIN
jgi:hypothetical protein